MIAYEPQSLAVPMRVLPEEGFVTGWRGLERILGDIVGRFCRGRHTALEFGVEYGYSTVALSNYFAHVIGVDHFKGDAHAGLTPEGVDRYQDTKQRLAQYKNIVLIQSDAEEYCRLHACNYDLVHVDALHDFETTYKLGSWAAHNSPCVLFHDTIWFPDVAPAVERIAKEQKRTAYNYNDCNGLAILV